MHTGTGAVEIINNEKLITAIFESCENITESTDRALRVMKFTIGTGLNMTPFVLHHARKLRTDPTNIVRERKSYLSDWSALSVLAPNRTKIPIYVCRDAEGEVSSNRIMARAKAEEKQLASAAKSPKKNVSKRYPFNFVEKNHNRESLESRFQRGIQTAICGTENNVRTDTGRIIY